MREAAESGYRTVYHKGFDGSLSVLDARGELFDCIALFMVERRYISPVSKQIYETTLTFELGCFGEYYDGEYWFCDPTDELNKFIVDDYGHGDWYSEIVGLPTDDAGRLSTSDGVGKYIEHEKTDRVVMEWKCTLCELIRYYVEEPEVDISPYGVKHDKG